MENKNSYIDVKKVLGQKLTPSYQTITNNDSILYALSIGFNEDGLTKDHFKFTYENEDNFQTFPTLAAVVGERAIMEIVSLLELKNFNPMMILYGEENIEFAKTIPINTKVKIQETCVDF